MRFLLNDDGNITDSLTDEIANIGVLLDYANAWHLFSMAISSGDDRVDDVLARAGLQD